MSSNGIRGDVIYYAPCGKKLCSYAQVLRHLQKNPNDQLDKDNLSFSSKLVVGEFLQVKPEAGKNGIVKIGEAEVRHQIEQSCQNTVARKLVAHNAPRALAHSKNIGHHGHVSKQHCTAGDSNEQHKDVSGRMQQMLEALGRTQHHKLNKHHLDLLNRQKSTSANYYQLMMGLDHDKIKRYLESQLPVLDRKQNLHEHSHPAAAKPQEHASPQQPFLKVKQSKVPTEDLELEESKTLPDLEPLSGLDVSGKTFADLLMVMEFVSNFGHVLRIDPNDVPSLVEMHAGLMNDSRYINKVRQFTIVLLTLVIQYPGLPAGAGGRTLVGQVARDLPINKDNMDELLRMFLAGRGPDGKQLPLPLQNAGFECLSPGKKAEVLSFLCDELLYCRNVVREIEGNVEEVTRLKGERWIKEGRVRLLRGIQAKKRVQAERKAQGLPIDNDEDETAVNNEPATKEQECSDSAEQERPLTPVSPAESTDSESRTIAQVRDNLAQSPPSAIVSPSPAPPIRQLPPGFGGSMGGKPKVMIPGIGQAETVTDEEKAMDVGELETLINTLNTESEDFRKRIITNSNKVRAQPLGEDRYHRLYWCLPSMQDTILVESVESSAVHNPTFDVHDLVVEKNNTHCSHVVTSVLDGLVNAVTAIVGENENDSHKLAEPKVTKKPRSRVERPLKKIPYKSSKGWFALRGVKDIDRLQKGFIMRGIRERNLYRVLGKMVEHNEDTASNVPSLIVPDPQTLVTGEHCDIHRLRKVLQVVTSFQEKILHANVHKRNWRPLGYHPPAASDVSSKAMQNGQPLSGKQAVGIDVVRGPVASLSGIDDDATQDSVASSTTTDSSSALATTSVLSHQAHTNCDKQHLLNIIKQRVLDAEMHLESRYLKQPYNHGLSPLARLQLQNELDPEENSQSNHSGVNGQDTPSNDTKPCETDPSSAMEAQLSANEVAAELVKWRCAVAGCRTGAQLVLCIIQMDKHIAWERSIMRASCQLCTGGENESELLLCDGCDRGFHTYCFKPSLPCIPAGDWFCPMCVTKASNKQCCILCCKQEPHSMDHCHECNRDFHKECLAPAKGYTKSRPTAAGVPLVTWTCPNCLKKTSPIKTLNSHGSSARIEPACSHARTPSPTHSNSHPTSTSHLPGDTPLENGANTNCIAFFADTPPTPPVKIKKKPGRKPGKLIKVETKEGKEKEKEKEKVPKVRKKRKTKEEKLLEESMLSNASTGLDSSGLDSEKEGQSQQFHWKDACSRMAAELEVHKDAWPFQLPVDTRKFPLYKKVIHTPMHIKQVVSAVQQDKYECMDSFVVDVNLILDNCRTFNEDDSPVGKAGASLRKFFNKRWKQLTDNITVAP